MMKTDSLNGISAEIKNQIPSMGMTAYSCINLEMIWNSEVEIEGNRTPLPLNNPVLEWDNNHGGYQQFLQTAKSLGVSVVYIKEKHFSWQKDLYNPAGADNLEEDILRNIQRYRNYDGFMEYIILAFNLNGMWHAYQETAEWYNTYQAMLEEISGEQH